MDFPLGTPCEKKSFKTARREFFFVGDKKVTRLHYFNLFASKELMQLNFTLIKFIPDIPITRVLLLCFSKFKKKVKNPVISRCYVRIKMAAKFLGEMFVLMKYFINNVTFFITKSL